MNIELSGCPFCGARAQNLHMVNKYGARKVWETGCAVFCVTMRGSTKKELIERWNKRTVTDKEGNS